MDTKTINNSINIILTQNGTNAYHQFIMLDADKKIIEKMLEKTVQEVKDLI